MNPSVKGSRGKPAVAKNKRKSREELNIEARDRKRQKKHRGLVSGSRAQEGNRSAGGQKGGAEKDSRLGSKKPVPLLADAPISVPARKIAEPEVVLTAAQELKLLENDDRLDELLQKLEQDETLSETDQTYVDETLDRIDQLMTKLGIEIEDDDEEEEQKNEDMLQLLKRGHHKDKF